MTVPFLVAVSLTVLAVCASATFPPFFFLLFTVHSNFFSPEDDLVMIDLRKMEEENIATHCYLTASHFQRTPAQHRAE